MRYHGTAVDRTSLELSASKLRGSMLHKLAASSLDLSFQRQEPGQSQLEGPGPPLCPTHWQSPGFGVTAMITGHGIKVREPSSREASNDTTRTRDETP